MGANDFVYQWFLNDFPIAVQHTSILVIDAVSEDNTGDYKCFVRNQYKGIGQSEVVKLVLGNHCVLIFKNDLGIYILQTNFVTQ